MMRRFLLASLGLFALAGVLALQAQEPSKSARDDTNKIKDKLTLEEQIIARRYSEFEQSLLKLKQRLEKSPNPEHRERAAILQKALDKAKDASLSMRFEQLVEFLQRQKLSSINQIESAQKESLQLAEDLRAILDLLRQDSRTADLREKARTLEDYVKQLDDLIRREKAVRAQTELGKTEKGELKGAQDRVAGATAKLGKQMAGDKDKKGEQGGEAKNTKGETKDGGKGEGKKGESKDAGKDGEGKKGASKEGGKNAEGKEGKKAEAKGGDPKGGDPKSGKNGEAKAKTAEAKAGGDPKGQGKQGEAKSGQGKEGKQGEAKAGEPKSGQGKQGEAKAGGEKKPGEKAGEKTAEAKAGGEKKAGEKSPEAKQGEPKAGAKSGEAKQGEAKAGSPKDGKPSEAKSGGEKSQSKPAEAKSGDSKSGKGEPKSGGQPKGGDPSASKSDPNQKQPPPKAQEPQDDFAKARKRIQDSYDNQKDAVKKIEDEKNKEAGKDQDTAIDNLEKAKKKLEDLLRQLREEEQERLLAALQARCERMLAMQIRVLDGTVTVYKAIDANADKKATRLNQQDSLKLSDDEKEIVLEATKAIEMLEAEGSAVAFPEVFNQVREDMKHVQRRLGTVDTGKVTQAIEEDIISTLKEMIEALKKAKEKLDQKKNPPPPGSGQAPPQADQKLLDQIAELKMIRSMQIRVNDRTKLYGRQYEGQEQTNDAQLRRELHGLSERQERIFEVTNRIAKGDNR